MSTDTDVADVELAITGMTCASCANRIERKLNKLDGVTATVNYATEKAKVTYPGTVSTDELLRDGRVRRLRRCAADAARRTARRRRADDRPAAAAAAHQRRAEPPGRGDGDGARVAVHLLAVGLARARRTGRGVGRLAVPPRRVDQPAPRRDDDGHPRLGRRAGRLRLVAVGAVPRHGRGDRDDPPVPDLDRPDRRRGQHLPRGRGRGHHLPAGRALARAPLEAPVGRRAAGPAASSAPARWRSSATTLPVDAARCGSRPTSWSSATSSSYVRARRSPPTARSSRAPPRSTPRC